MMDKEAYLDQSAYVSASSYRIKILKALYGEEIYKTPTQIAKETQIRRGHVSNVLAQLKKEHYVFCINEHRRKNRLYCLSNFGKDVCGFMVDNKMLV